MSVFGLWPMAMKQPCTASSGVLPSCVFFSRTPVTPLLSPSTSSSVCHRCSCMLPAALRHQLVDQDRLGAEFVAAMDQVHLARDVRQVQRFLDRGIAAADDADFLAPVEKAVAGRAAATPLPMNFCSDGRPRYLADAPVAMISASQV